jgi:hypothetical protein
MGPIRDVTQAAQAVETCLLRQLIDSSGVFRGDGMAGSQIHSQMFVDALADAVEKGGGIGLARLIESSLPATTTADATPTIDDPGSGEPDALNNNPQRAEAPTNKRPRAKGDWP